jgi:hypothetical protein
MPAAWGLRLSGEGSGVASVEWVRWRESADNMENVELERRWTEVSNGGPTCSNYEVNRWLRTWGRRCFGFGERGETGRIVGELCEVRVDELRTSRNTIAMGRLLSLG